MCFLLLILAIHSSHGQAWGSQVGQCSQPFTLAKGFSVLLKTINLRMPELEGKVNGSWS